MEAGLGRGEPRETLTPSEQPTVLTTWPDPLTRLLDRTKSPDLSGAQPAPEHMASRALSLWLSVIGLAKCVRTECAMTVRTATNPTMVTAMAGSVRRISTPVVRPRAKAKAA